MSTIERFLKRNSPTILSYLAATGVVATTITAIKATPKAKQLCDEVRANSEDEPSKLDYVRAAWKCYVPTTVLGAATIGCIFGSNKLNAKQIASLTSAYLLLEKSYKKYKNAVRRDTPSVDLVNNDRAVHYIPSTNENMLFFEEHYGKFFEIPRKNVIKAEYRLNLKLASDGYASLNDFYKFLGLPLIEAGDAIGWSLDKGCAWLDFTHEMTELEDGMECCIIDISVLPSVDYL